MPSSGWCCGRAKGARAAPGWPCRVRAQARRRPRRRPCSTAPTTWATTPRRAPGRAAAWLGAPPPPAAGSRPHSGGNDAAARPWEGSGMAGRQPAAGVVIGSGLAGAQNWGVPEGFDTDGFLAAAKRNFVTLQAAWDRSDISTLRSMMTDDMLGEIRAQLAEREAQHGAQSQQTEAVMIEARLLGIEDQADCYMASVEFSGMIREEPSAGASPFREVWNMTKSKAGSTGWLVAGVQALQ